MKFVVITVLYFLLNNQFVMAQEPSSPMTFAKWKEMQVNDAQNGVVRLSNSLLLLKTERYDPSRILPEVATDIKEEESSSEMREDLIQKTEQQLKMALERLEFTKELGFKDYFSVYLERFKSSDEALTRVAQQLSSSEVVDLLKVILNASEVTPPTLTPQDSIFSGGEKPELAEKSEQLGSGKKL